MAKFVLQNNYFEFNGEAKQQISGTAIGTTFAPPYVCIFMDQVESEFLKTQTHQPLVWFRYVDDIFFIWTNGQDKLEQFLVDLNKFHPFIKLNLVRAKLYPIERSVGLVKCNVKQCQVCLNVTETKTFSSTVTNKEYIINHKFNCNGKCLIYLLAC